MIQVQETLRNPINEPLQFAKLYIYTVTSGETLLDSKATIEIGANGVVDFSLVQGDYRVYLLQTEGGIEYPIGYISKDVFDTVTSPTTLTAIITSTLPEEIV